MDEKPAPEAPPEPRDEWDDWYDRYDVSSLAGKLDMFRALLTEDHSLPFYTDIDFVSAVLEAPCDSSDDDTAPDYAFLNKCL